jgi:hypothetical protein
MTQSDEMQQIHEMVPKTKEFQVDDVGSRATTQVISFHECLEP